MVTWIQATDVNTDLNCSWTTAPQTALSSILGLDNVLAPGGSTDHSDQDDSGGGMTSRHQQGHKLWLQPLASMSPLAATRTTDFNTDSNCCRTMDPDMVLDSSQKESVMDKEVNAAVEDHKQDHSSNRSLCIQCFNMSPSCDRVLSTSTVHLIGEYGKRTSNLAPYDFIATECFFER
ncbi:hypothetical protein STEG23_026441 [Scotinomys teguina]